MAYSAAWNEAAPVGSTTQASDIDTVFQNLKRDLRERLNALVVDWTTDPVVPKQRLGVSVYHSVGQNHSATPLAFDSERFDSSGFHDTVTNNSRLTVPTGLGGTYMINSGTLMASTNTTTPYLWNLRKNGATLLRNTQWIVTSGTSNAIMVGFTAIEQLVDADYVEVIFDRNGGTGTGTAALGLTGIWFEMMKM